MEALRRAIVLRKPMPGCVFHSDRGSQYASEKHRNLLGDHGFLGSMSRRGNPYDNPQAESFMKTLKVEDAYLHRPRVRWDTSDGLFDGPMEVTRWTTLRAERSRAWRSERLRLWAGSGG